MLEQELASIIKFVLESSGNPSPFYWKVPEKFRYPAVYFPQPEITSGGETFRTYRLEYAWYIVFFGKTDEEAHTLARATLEAIRRKRNLIPLINEDGSEEKRGIRLDDPSCKRIDNGAVQLTLTWASRRPYDRKAAQKAVDFYTTYTVRNRRR